MERTWVWNVDARTYALRPCFPVFQELLIRIIMIIIFRMG